MKRRTMLVAILSAALASSVAAQPGNTPPASAEDDESDGPEAKAALPVELDQLIEVAVTKSPDLARAKIDRLAAIDQAQGERRAMAWILFSNAQWSRNAASDHVEVPAFTEMASEKTQGTVGIHKLVSTGGSIQVQVGVTHSETEYNIVSKLHDQSMAAMMSPAGSDSNGTPLDVAVVTQAQLTVTAKQPLGRGFGPDVALAGEKRADLQATEATVKAQLAGEQMVKDIVTAYWELAYNAYETDVRAQAIELAKKQEELTHEQMRAGTAPPNSINAVNYELATREGDLLRAQLTLEQKSLELREKVGLELSRRDIVMRPAVLDHFEIGKEDFDVDQVLTRARAANRQLADNFLQKKIADIEVSVAQDQVKPKLDLEVTGALIGNSDSVGGSLGGLTGADAFQVSVALNMEFELSGAARKARDAATTRRKKVDADRATLERQIETQTVTAVHQVSAARQRVALYDRAISVAEDTVRSERNNYMAGRTQAIEVMRAQGKLIDARLSRGRAVADYHIAVAQLQFLSGLILDQYRINVRPHR